MEDCLTNMHSFVSISLAGWIGISTRRCFCASTGVSCAPSPQPIRRWNDTESHRYPCNVTYVHLQVSCRTCETGRCSLLSPTGDPKLADPDENYPE